MEPDSPQNTSEAADNSNSAVHKTENPQALRHEKVLAPLDTTLRPEGIITPVKTQPVDNTSRQMPTPAQPALPQPLQTTPSATTNAFTQSSNLTPPETEAFNEKKYWAGKAIKLIITGFIGFFLTGSYFYYWDGSDFTNKVSIATQHYSPLILGDTIIATIIFIIIYGLVLRFILRSRYAFGQSSFATLSTQLLSVGIIGAEHSNSQSINIFGNSVTFFTLLAALIGAVIFAGSNYLSEKVWTWRISRSMLAIGSLAALCVVVFGLSQAIGISMAKKQQQQEAASAKAQKDADAGIYDFNGSYQQFYLKDSMQSRFEISKIAAYNEAAKEKYGTPHYTVFTLHDKNNDRVEFTLWQTKATTSTFNPPSLCDSPNPTFSNIDYLNKWGTYAGACTKLRDIPGVGTLYGRDQNDKYKNIGDYQGKKERAAGLFEWYYIKRGDTLLTIEDNQKTLGTDGAVAIFSGLLPISPTELLAKSKQLATGRSVVKSSGQAISFPVYSPSNTAGLSFIGAYLTNKEDPSNLVILLKYDNNNSFDTIGFMIHEYKRPQKFNPPYCGYEAPGLGVASDSCKLVGTTAPGKTVYSNGHFYWGDFGDTIISLSGASSKADALNIYESMSSTSPDALHLQ